MTTRYNNPKAIEYFLSEESSCLESVSLDTQDSKGRAAILLAEKKGCPRIVQMFIDSGASICRLMTYRNESQQLYFNDFYHNDVVIGRDGKMLRLRGLPPMPRGPTPIGY